MPTSTAVQDTPKPWSPAAFHMTVRPRAEAIAYLKDFKPLGNPKPELVKEAIGLALRLIDLHPEDVQGIEAKIEIGGALAHQINVIVYPHKW